AGGGRATFDRQCGGGAGAAGLVGRFRALVATSTEAAFDGLASSCDSWHRPGSGGNGARVEPGAGAPEAPSAQAADRSYVPKLDSFVWSGAPNPTSLAVSLVSCEDWSSTTAAALVGWASSTDYWMGYRSAEDCVLPRRVYCLQR